MKFAAYALTALALATGSASAAGLSVNNERPDGARQPAVAEKTVEVSVNRLASTKDLARAGINSGTVVSVSDFSHEGPLTYRDPR